MQFFFFCVGGGGCLRPIKIIFQFEPSQSLGGAKMGDPQVKPPD